VRLYAALFAVGLAIYGALAWKRLGHGSTAPHFVYQADAWLHGSISIEPPLIHDDWAKVETVVLDDGSEVRGRRMMTRPMFRTLSGDELPMRRIAESRDVTWYMSFPPFPTLLMLPSAAIAGRAGNDVIPTILIAALILPLTLWLLRRLAEAKLSNRSRREDLWLVVALAFGSVLLFCSVRGEVWYTAHVVGVALALVYAWASIEAKHPWVAGLALGAAALTRTSMAFMFPLFVFEAYRVARPDQRWRDLRRPMIAFAIPIAALAGVGMAYNAMRFGSPTEFGHTYLHVRQQAQIEQWGLMSAHYLSRNLAVALTLLPEWLGQPPWIQISGHGLAVWVTTPLLLLLLWPRERPPIHLPLWITIACIALPSLLYQNSGWVQFGYRFSLDYMVFFVMLLAVGGRPLLGRYPKLLIILGILVNLYGAFTFDRGAPYYRIGGMAYDDFMAK
jgi:hypothetical protein